MEGAIHPNSATVEEALARDENDRIELIRGRLTRKPPTTVAHSEAQTGTLVTLGGLFQRARGGPGGWRLFTELDVQLGSELFRPDICGYRRERMTDGPRTRPVKIVPDWVCEVLSVSNESHDRVEKQQTYFRAGVPHYWLINPLEGTLEVFRRTDLAFALVLAAHRGQTVRAEPFDAVEIKVDELLAADSADD